MGCVQSLAFWNISDETALSIVDFSLEASLSSDFSSSTSLGSFSATVPSGNPTTADVFNFAPTNAQFLRLNVLSNNGGPIIGLGEVVFEGSEVAETVPEPTTLMGLLVMGGAGLLAKRKKFIK